jgi:hypothetical protein
MSKTTEPIISEMINSAGDGSGLQLPPAFVLVNPKQHRKYKKNNTDYIDGRSKGAKKLLSRISRRKKMKEELEQIISEAVPSETERAQKQIGQQKKLNRQKDLQKKRDEAKKKMMDKTKEMDILMKARLSDFKKRASKQQQKVSTKESFTNIGKNIMIESTQLDALDVALQVATSELDMRGETTFAKIQFDDGSSQNLDNFSAKKIAAAYASLAPENQDTYRYMLNKNASTYQSALDFAVKNI